MSAAPIALTSGDPAGIGAEIALKAWAALRGDLPFFLIGDLSVMAAVGKALGHPIVAVKTPAETVAASTKGLPVLHLACPGPVTPGTPTPANAPAIIAAIEHAVRFVQSGAASALVTNPIHKKALKDGADFAFPGHTEFLAHLAGGTTPVMMLAAPELRVVPVTIHIPLAAVPAALTADLLERTIRIAHASLISDFGITAPRLCVAGLNPHAGEGGVMGREEIKVITPVLDRLRAEGMVITGPVSADTMFHAGARATYDLAICMYHDQALIPLKTLNFSSGVNATLGLPFVRTSPDHGTAYDIAGKGIADPQSLIAALELARDMAARRSVA